MHKLKSILTLLLLAVFCSSATGAELYKRGENYNIYKTGDTYRMEMGGEVSNAEPFDYDGPMEPQSYDFSNATQIAPDVWRLSKGNFGFTANLSDTTSGGIGGGCLRTHPVRKHWEVYYEICPVTPIALERRQVNNKLLELYKDTSQVRYSFLIGDIGFKLNIRLKPSYTGGDTFIHTFDVAMAGLTRQGRKVFYQGKEVGDLPDPFYTDSSGGIDVWPVQETLQGSQVVLTATGINSRVLPVNIDPTLTPPASNAGDTMAYQASPTTNYGTNALLGMYPTTGSILNTVIVFDASALPLVATITSAVLELYYESFGGVNDPVGRTAVLSRATRVFVEGDGSAGSGATWNTYDGTNPWTTVGGDFTAVDAATAVVPGSFGWMSWTVTAQAQYAYDNTAGLINMHIRDSVGTATVYQTHWHSSNAVGVPTLLPKMSITYTVPSDFVTHLGYKQIVF